MEFFIDGHNLIPKVSGIRLSDDNDEQELLERIQEFARLTGRRCTVFFDKAPDFKTRDESYGTVHVVYVTHTTKADEEIINRVNDLSKARIREVTVVSSDQHVQWQCHRVGAATMTSEKFASEMMRVFNGEGHFRKGPKQTQGLEPKLSPKEVDEWLEIFNAKR